MKKYLFDCVQDIENSGYYHWNEARYLKDFLGENPEWNNAEVIKEGEIDDNFTTYYYYDFCWLVKKKNRHYNMIISKENANPWKGRNTKLGVIYKRIYLDGEVKQKRKRSYSFDFDYKRTWQVINTEKRFRNDCQIWTLAICLGITYERAHEILSVEGWSEESTNLMVPRWEKALNKLNIKYAQVWERFTSEKGLTLKTVAKYFPKGTFHLSVKGHTCCLKDGIIYDSSFETQYKRIEYIYKVG